MSLSGNTELLNQLKTILANKAAGSGGVDLPTLTTPGTAANLLEGYELIGQDGQIVTGTMPVATQATPSITVSSDGMITASAAQTAGYVAAGTKKATKQLTVQAAKTWAPGASDQTLASGRYLTGVQTIKGDANLKAANIIKGVSIFGVAGAAEVGGSSDADLDALIDGSITTVTSQAASVRTRAFSGCASLASVSLPAAKTIGSYAFMQCAKLATVSLPEVTTLSSAAFSTCAVLTDVTIPKVTALPSQAFYSCTALQKIDLPAVESIADSVFMIDNALTTVILRSETLVTLSNKSAFSSSAISAGTGYIYVPSALVDSYKAATNWSTYAAQIRAIEDYPDITGG